MRFLRAMVITATIIAAAFLAGALLSRTDWSPASIRASKERGDQIAQALDAYRHDQGKYPEELIHLVPKYLQEIPVPLAGLKQWRYRPAPDGSRYVLKFQKSADNSPEVFRGSDDASWGHDSK